MCCSSRRPIASSSRRTCSSSSSPLAFIALYALIRAAVRLAKLPGEVREGRRRRQFERFRNKQDAAVVASARGAPRQGAAVRGGGARDPTSSPVAALVGARAALETRDYEAAEAMLERPDAQATSLAVPRLMLEAEMQLERGQPAEALAHLADLRREAGLHTAALRLELRALTAAGRPAEIPPLVDQLVKRKVYDRAAGRIAARRRARGGARCAVRTMPAGLRAYWARVPDTEQLQPKVARAAARSFLQLGRRSRSGGHPRTKSRAELGLEPADALRANAARPTRRGSSKMPSAGSSRTTRTRRCSMRSGGCASAQQLWGKAQTYLEASLALDNHWRAHVALGEHAREARPSRRSERASRRRAEARARGARARRLAARQLLRSFGLRA